MHNVHFSSAAHDWETPQPFFNRLDAEFDFTLDPAATAKNAKCATYYTPEDDGLALPWPGVVFVNPPYGYGIKHWVAKAYAASQAGATVVMLMPARTDTAYWHDFVMRAAEVRLLRGRLYFSGAKVNAPFPCCVVIWRPEWQGDTPAFISFDRGDDHRAC